MLQRYDHRLAEFAQTLNDALNQTLPARITAAISGTPRRGAAAVEAPDHSNVVRVLELAREQTAADAAVAIVGTKRGADPRDRRPLADARSPRSAASASPTTAAHARSRSRSTGDDAPRDGNPIRSGLAIPLLDSPNEPGMLAVLTRTPDRRFSEIDITSLENVLSVTRPALETSLELREPDPVPERDPLTDLYDRPAFHALLDREIGRARGRREQMALLMLDVDRLTTINARIGHLAADEVLATDRPRPERRRRPTRPALPDRRRPLRRRPLAGRQPRRRAALRAPAGGAPRAPLPEHRRRLVLGRRRRAAPEGRRDRAHRARGCRARAREELGPRHGRDGREAAEPRRRLAARRRREAAQRDASASCSERNGANAESVTTPSSGQPVALADELALAAFCMRIVHAAYASARRSARSSRVTAAARVWTEHAPSAVVSSRASTTNAPRPSDRRAPAGGEPEDASGADVASATPRPPEASSEPGETVDLPREHRRERRPEARHVAGRDPREREPRDDLAPSGARRRGSRARPRGSPGLRRAPRDTRPRSRRSARRRPAAPARARPTARPRPLALDRARDERGQRELAVARHLRERGDARGRQRRRSVDAARARRRFELPRLRVGVELAAEDRRRVAEARVARPQPDAGRVRLVRVVRALVALRPAPRPDVREPSSFATCFTASACHFATLNQRDRGRSPRARPRPARSGSRS